MKVLVPTPVPDNAQQWVLEDFQATEISHSWKRFLVAPEPQPEPPTLAEAAQGVTPPAEAVTEAEDLVAVAEAQDLKGEEVHGETVALDDASEEKEYGETAEVSTVWVEGRAAAVEEVTAGFTEVSTEDAIPADEPVSSKATVAQEVEEVATATWKCSTSEATALASAALHESSDPGKIGLCVSPSSSTPSRGICLRETCVVGFFHFVSTTYL